MFTDPNDQDPVPRRSSANRSAIALFVALLVLAAAIVAVGFLITDGSTGSSEQAVDSPATSAASAATPLASATPVEAAPSGALPAETAAAQAAVRQPAPTGTEASSTSTPVPEPDLVAIVPAPEGHETKEIGLPPSRALGGDVRAGDIVTIIVNGSDGTYVLGEAEVLNSGASFDGSERRIARVLLALEPAESVALTEALATGEITLASREAASEGYYAVTIELPADRALDGKFRPGDLVSLIDAEGAAYLLSDVRVLTAQVLSADGLEGSAPATYYATVAVETADLATLIAAIADGDLALALPG